MHAKLSQLTIGLDEVKNVSAQQRKRYSSERTAYRAGGNSWWLMQNYLE